MNDISRIHIGKTPFNIEPDAKKTLEAYLGKLSANLNDSEVYADIEQRIVELLAARNISADGVISDDDVEAVTEQLGQPEEFLGETANNQPTGALASRRLFREPNRAMLGGVASGLAAYLGISVIWIRLLLVSGFFISGGTVLILYVLMWIIVPPVRSAADQLQLEGKPVTVSTIQSALHSAGSFSTAHEQSLVRVVTVCIGIGLSLAALAAVVTSAVGSYGLLFHDAAKEGFFGYQGHELMYTTTGLFGLSGLVLASLFIVLAYAAFTQRLTHRVVVTLVVIVLLGLVSFASATGMAFYLSHQQSQMMPFSPMDSGLFN